MTRRHWIALALATMLPTLGASTVAAADPARAIRVPVPDGQLPLPTEPVAIPAPFGPCIDPLVHCPDLALHPPSELRVIRGRNGRLRLGSRNVLVNRGRGPLSLEGTRIGRRTMSVVQRVYNADGTHVGHPLERARLDFWPIPGQGRIWKLRDGLRFELWTAGRPLAHFVRPGRKTRFCMRDLFEEPGLLGPRSRIFGVCSQIAGAGRVRMGISAGWAESYPAFYHEQYVDITDLRGCFSLRHVADPLGRVFESDESNNTSQRRVLLPPRNGRVRGC